MVPFTDYYNAISIDWLPSKTKIGKVLWYFNNSLLCKLNFSSAANTFFINKDKKAIILQQVTGGNTPNLVLKRILRYFPFKKTKKILQFQDIISRQKLKTHKTTTLQQVTGGEPPNLVLNKMLNLFLKIPPLFKNIKILRLKEDSKTYREKENFKRKLNQWLKT